MSVRIHELAKRIEVDNKELLSLLKGRGFDVKTVSSTIDPISAEAIEAEFREKRKAAAEAAAAQPAEVAPAPAPAPVAAVEPPPADIAARVPAAPQFSTKIPQGVGVRSAADIAREKAEAEKEAMARRVIAPPPAPVARPAARFVTPPPPARPAPVTPPPIAPRPAPAAPPPLAPPPAVPRPVSASPAPVSIPRPAPVAAPPVRPPVTSGPAPVSAPAPVPVPAPSAPPPLAAPKPLAPPPSLPPRSPAPATPPPPAAAAAPSAPGEIKILHLKPPIIVRDFATAIGVKPFRLISELMEIGIFGSLNQAIEESVAVKLAEKHGFLLEVKHRGETAPVAPAKEKEKKPEEDESKFLEPRPPVVCILGHVDHGKTTLLDTIRKTNVAAGEAGGITQRIGAYQIEHAGRKITFLDTPGHAAFNKMRARGANVTDIAVLVVAADDGFMPQTDEALKYIKSAKVALIVAMNKADVKGANFDRVKMQMQERGIPSEDWGGETIAVKVAAIKGEGVTDLLEYIGLQADVLELKANPKAPASGAIIEAEVEVGRGSTATVIVQRGTLRVGDAVVCGPAYTKVKALFNDKGQQIKEAPPSTPVKIIGWSETPEAGQQFRVVKNDREAKALAEEAAQELRNRQSTAAASPKDVSVDALFANIAATQKPTLKVVAKCDFFGSVEAVRNLLEGIKSEKVALEIVSADVGQISKNDVLMASAAGATIIGFNTRAENGVAPVAKHHNVPILQFDIIYELADRVRDAMADLLPPDLKEVKLGGAEVRAVFPVAKGFVAGCLVTDGKITRNARARVRRGREILHESTVSTLRRFKDDANEVRAGLECGIGLEGFGGYQPGDLIECFEIQKIRASL